MHFFGEVCGFGGAVAQPHGGYHVTFGGCAHACASPFEGLGAYFFPKMTLGALDFFSLRIGIDFFKYGIDFLHFQVDYIIHDTLGFAYMFGKQLIIKFCLGGEGILHIGIKIDSQQPA